MAGRVFVFSNDAGGARAFWTAGFQPAKDRPPWTAGFQPASRQPASRQPAGSRRSSGWRRKYPREAANHFKNAGSSRSGKAKPSARKAARISAASAASVRSSTRTTCLGGLPAPRHCPNKRRSRAKSRLMWEGIGLALTIAASMARRISRSDCLAQFLARALLRLEFQRPAARIGAGPIRRSRGRNAVSHCLLKSPSSPPAPQSPPRPPQSCSRSRAPR